MIKKGIKDYLRCLKYYLVPFGLLTIFFVIGLYASITGITNTVKEFITEASELAHQAHIDWGAMWNALVGEVMKVNYNQTLNGIVGDILNVEWLGNTLKAIVSVMFGDSITPEQIQEVLTKAVTGIVVNIMILFLLIILGFVVGIVLMKVLLRKELTHIKVGRLILYSLADAAIWVLLFFAINGLARIADWTKILVPILVLIVLPLFCLLEGYVFYAIKKVKFKEVMNIKSLLKIYAIDGIIIVISAAITALLILIFNKFIGVFLAIPVIEIAIIAIGLTSEGYVVNLANEKNKAAQLEEQKA